MAPPIHHEQYRGEPLQISTTHHPDGTWTASTHPMTTATAPHPTEDDAKREALSHAVAAKDRARAHTGKP